MKLTNINNLPQMENWDVYNLMLTKLDLAQSNGQRIKLNLFNKETEYDEEYFDYSTSEFFFDRLDTFNEFEEKIYSNEKEVKRYKKAQAFYQKAINENMNNNQFEFTILEIK